MRGIKLRISRVTTGVMLVFLLTGMLVSAAYAATSVSFKDTMGHWAAKSIQRVSFLRIMTGYADGSYKPDEKISRAQMAAVIDRTLNVLKYEDPADKETITKGGRLYDNWMLETGNAIPKTDQPLWATQSTNTRSGETTWRCKECHGWDYKGKGGAYSTGSRATGFSGVYRASTTMSKASLLEVLKGATDYRHDFSKVLNDQELDAMAAFLREGLINYNKYVDYTTKKPIEFNITSGKQKYEAACAPCHGANGKQLNFGSEQTPEYVGTVAVNNPWEFIHKVRMGQPDSNMPSADGWALQDVVDVLAHAQTLPIGK